MVVTKSNDGKSEAPIVLSNGKFRRRPALVTWLPRHRQFEPAPGVANDSDQAAE
jgi:hypothetical protein